MSIISNIWESIKSFFKTVIDFVKKVIKGILNFFVYVVAWFKGLKLRKGIDNPFIVDAKMLKKMIKEAPVVDCGIFEAVYNEEKDTIEHMRVVEAEELDDETKNVLSKAEQGLVVLN